MQKFIKDYMERQQSWMVNLLLKAYLLLALVPHICISQANSAHLDKYVSREISNNEKPGMYNYFIDYNLM